MKDVIDKLIEETGPPEKRSPIHGFMPFVITVLAQSGRAFANMGDYRTALIYLGLTFSGLAGYIFTTALFDEKKHAKLDLIGKNLMDCFQKEGIILHSFSRYCGIPASLINRTKLMRPYVEDAGTDYLSFQYRNVEGCFSNIALSGRKTPDTGLTVLLKELAGIDTSLDSYEGDDVEAKQRLQIDDENEVPFYGSVFIFTPGPDIDGSVSLEVKDPDLYLRQLQNLQMDDFLSDIAKGRNTLFDFEDFHFIHGRRKEGNPEIEKVFTQRVKSMVLSLESTCKAPVEIYADKNVVCLTIQTPVFEFEQMDYQHLEVSYISDKAAQKAERIRHLLDLIIGPDGDEYTELFSIGEDRRKSVYSPFIYPAESGEFPTEREVRIYIRDVANSMVSKFGASLLNEDMIQIMTWELSEVRDSFNKLVFEDDTEAAEAWASASEGKRFMEELKRTWITGLWNIITETGEYQIGKVRVIYSAANPMLGNIEAKLYFSPPRRRIPFAGEILGQTAAEYGSKDELLNALNRVEGRDAFIDTVRKKLKALLPGKTEFEPMEYEFNMWRLDNDAYGLKFEDYINFYTWGWSLILERSGLSKHIEKANESRV